MHPIPQWFVFESGIWECFLDACSMLKVEGKWYIYNKLVHVEE